MSERPSGEEFQHEVAAGERFRFGDNWTRFLAVLNDERIAEAERSLRDYLGLDSLQGMRFLDVGSGSGLFSLAARRLGADVLSFDYDPQSVACTQELRARYFPDDRGWEVTQGSILDHGFVTALGEFDVVYAWGVLHHTGAVWTALYNAQSRVRPGGLFYVALYRDQGIVSAIWKVVKQIYCAGPFRRGVMTALFFPLFFLAGLAIDLATLRDPRSRYRDHVRLRGMSLIHDWRDWLGGYPYEPVSAEGVTTFLENLGHTRLRLEPPPIGFGNNQFVFRRGE